MKRRKSDGKNSISIMKINKIGIFYRGDNLKAHKLEVRILGWFKKNYPKIAIDNKKPQALLVLGGDGTILEAAKKYQKSHPVIVGFNLGSVGFLASARREDKFLPTLEKLIKGNFSATKRMMIKVNVSRNSKKVFLAQAFNEI